MTLTQTIEALQKFAKEHELALIDLDIAGTIQDAIDDGIYTLNILEPEVAERGTSDVEMSAWHHGQVL